MGFILSDKLGRRAKYRSHTARPRFYEFNPRAGFNRISVDRLGITSDSEAAEVAIRSFTSLATDSREVRFLGWYVLSVRDVKRTGCWVECQPEPENPYHAHIVFPENRAVQEKHPYRSVAKELASHSKFKKWGDWE